MLNIPDTFQLSSRCPTLPELNALYDYLNGKEYKNVLEFGSGVTTYCITSAIKYQNYIAIEQHPTCIESVLKHCKIHIEPTWDRILDLKYNLVFCDGSTGYPKDLKPLTPHQRCPVPFRNDALNYVKWMLAPNCTVIIHDWCHTHDYQAPRRYLESAGWKLIWSYNGKYGLGAYQKPTC